jgi:predicted transcriptional regulator
MPTIVPKPRQLQRMAALAHLDAEELRIEVERERANIRAAASLAELSPEELDSFLDRLSELSRRMLRTLKAPIGLSVEQAAERLDVTAPTIRKWLKDGLLTQTPERKPAEIDPRSLIAVQRALSSVRTNYPARQWTKALAAYLHDRDLQSQDWVAEGMREFEHGEFVER